MKAERIKMYDLSKAYRILRRDPVMKSIISVTGKLEHNVERDVYFALLESIASQQLSVKAADTIFNRFLDLFPGRNPHPDKVIRINIEKMRNAGLSYAKSEYIKNIARYSKKPGLDDKLLRKLDDEALLDYLTAIKGVGRWTAEMILMFSLNRPDVFPVDDLGIRQSMIRHYQLKGEGKKLIVKMNDIAENWRPYRSLAARHLWRIKDSVS
jgi:DNA-3-methyladenine glycosylase II